VRAIPTRLMPHRAVVEPYAGDTPTGIAWDAARAPQRANFNPLTARGSGSGSSANISVAGYELTHTATVFLDDGDLPPLSKVTDTRTGRVFVVLTVKPWSHPDVANFLECNLADAPKGLLAS
jgi:hypothetical protein